MDTDVKYHQITQSELLEKHMAIKKSSFSNLHHRKISLLYTINVLEGMQPQWTEPHGFIQSEIDRLKTLLMNQL